MVHRHHAAGADADTVRALSGRLSGLSVALHSKSGLYGAFVWALRALNSKKRGFWPGRTVSRRTSLSTCVCRPRAPSAAPARFRNFLSSLPRFLALASCHWFFATQDRDDLRLLGILDFLHHALETVRPWQREDLSSKPGFRRVGLELASWPSSFTE